MTSGRPVKSNCPTPVSGVDMRSLPIGPTEAFVLSRVDGRSSESDIAVSTGLPASDVSLALLRLVELGAVRSADGPYADPPRNAKTSSPAEATVLPQAATPVVIQEEAPEPREPEGPLSYPPRELDEPADLDRGRKHLILSTYYRLERRNHYQLLGVPRSADRKAIKTAYYSQVSTFHPDKYFGKTLGSFKIKLEKIFGQVTEAHDVLTRSQSRAEYDRYLESQLATGALDDAETARAVEALQREVRQEARAAETPAGQSRFPTAPPPSGPPGSAPTYTPVPKGAPDPTTRAAAGALPTPEERRRALARKLSGASATLPPPAQRSEPATAPPVEERHASVRASADDALRRRYESRLQQAQAVRVKAYVDQADAAIAAGKPAQAVNALRLAVALAPEDRALAARFEELDRQAAVALADQYLEQARYEERRGRFLEAAQAYERLLRGRPTASAYERAAHCLLEARGEPRRATELARKAVELAPRDTAYRIVLARAYARAGLEQSALGELERAGALAPSDDTIKDWIRRVKRGEV